MTAAPAPQQALPLRVDCGDLNGYATPEAGWSPFGESQALAGVSLSPAALDTVHVAGLGTDGSTPVPSDCWAVDADELPQRHRLTSLKLADPSTLTVSGLPASATFRVRVELGALAPWADVVGTSYTLGAFTTSSAVKVEELVTPGTWRSVAQGVRCTTGYFSNSFQSVLGGIVPVWVLAHSNASGTLTLRFSSTATTGADPIFLAGFEVHAHEPLPVVYHAAGGQGPLVSGAPALAAYVAAFNADDYDAAEAAAAALADPFQRGVARCWLMGWLDGSRDGRMHLAPLARADLSAAAAAHPAVPWLLTQLDELERANDHLDARGYAWARKCPSEGGYGFLNPDCAGQTAVLGLQGHAITNVNGHAALRRLAGLCTPAAGSSVRTDIDTWNSGPIAYVGWEPGPFLFAALKQYGATIAAINPFLEATSNPASTAFRQAFDGVFQQVLTGGGIESSHFPLDTELALFREYSVQGLHPGSWSDASLAAVLSDAQIDSSWWGSQVAKVGAGPGWPGWVARQRAVAGAYRNATQYWLDERLLHGELGGGTGDDVEALAQLFLPDMLRREPAAPERVEALQSIVRWVLEESGDVSDGYYSGGDTDVQHSAEYTTNTFLAQRAALGHTASAAGTALGVTRHLLSAHDPAAAWAAPTALGRLHFKSYHVTAAGPNPDPAYAFDIPLNGRAMLPGVAAGRRGLFGAAHPLVADLTGWADAWRDDALDATAPKPVGFYGPVTWSANQFGGEGLWWTTADDQADTAVWGTGESSHQLELLRMAYHASTATDRWRYLLPAVRLFRAAQTWELAGKPANPPALPAASNVLWAAKSFYNSPRFHSMVVAHLHDLSNDPVLTTADDPAVSGTSPYVDAGLISRLTTWSEIETVGGLNQGLRYALLPVQPCGGPQQLKPQVNLETGYDKALLYLRAVYPFVTKHVLHTDRLMLSRATANLLASHVGASLLEGQPFRPRVQWVVPAGAWDELSILCNQLDYGGAVYGAFVHNSGAAPIAAELALDEGLLPGTYLIESGTASPGCDDFPSGSSLVSFTVSKRGGGLRVPVTLQPGLQRVRATRIGAPDSPASKYDLALDPPVFRMTPAPAGAPGVLPRAVIRVRVVNAGPAASPWATLQLFASIADPPLAPVTAIAGFDSLIHTASIPALPGATGYTLAEHTVQVTLPLAALGPILAGEYELRLRAEIAVDAREWDPLNNSLSRSVTLHDLTFLWPH